MERFMSVSVLLLVFHLLVSHAKPAMALPLSTNSRWIVNENGQRVKLTCGNWASHLETMVAEGLSKQPVEVISKRIVSMGFNCVRLTWPTFLVTNDSLSNVTVRQSFQAYGLLESIAGIQAFNPSIVDLPLIKAFQAVVTSLGQNNVMVILDNHISKPGWCCSATDGNGFFGDQYFNPDLWIEGLSRMAATFQGVSNVVGMSLRNELRGLKQNVDDWFRYMQKGSEAVHSANPKVLVILSGLSFDTDLSFLHDRSVNLSFTGKLVFEMHRYAFTDGSSWVNGNLNEVCGRLVSTLNRTSLFLLDKGWPLFVSEFGGDERGTNVNDNRFLNCFHAVLAEHDLDWALWTLSGSYYLREGALGVDEAYGVFSYNWCDTRNATYINRLSGLQVQFQGPGLPTTNAYKVIFHPSTGLCVLRRSLKDPLILGHCNESDAWSYTTQKIISPKKSHACLQADAVGKPAKLGKICTDSRSIWNMISDSKMQLSSIATDGTSVCLDIDSNNTIVTNKCKCLSQDTTCDPVSQWFKLVDTNNF
ncbi:Cellulase domain-containing protein [Cephalotus follicularis]|uniref:Cellulase domain-containing protein n=1 Tax=Cephalotus follicularis TaxID=3775 RepID=A0A1Q3D070_CEPFO|nr:Cellulase domain-containing protein [Cephalotus follicularis]